MKFNTAEKDQKKQAFSYFMKLANKRSVIEVKKISPNRSLRQNSYLHLLIGAFGVHFGYTLEEAKIIYKDINADIYKYVKGDSKFRTTFYRSSADLSVEEMTKSIDRFREKSAELGCPLPTATDQDWLRQIENDIETQYKYM